MNVYLIIEDEPGNLEYPSIVLSVHESESGAEARLEERKAEWLADRNEYLACMGIPALESVDDQDFVSWEIESKEVLP